MKRIVLPILIAIPVLAVVALGAHIAKPYVEARECTRELSVTPNLIDGRTGRVKPIVIRFEKELEEHFRQTKLRLGHLHQVGNQFEIANSERTLQSVDFKNECLVLIPYWRPYDEAAGLRAPRLVSRRLLCHVWFFYTGGGHLAESLECIALAVRRESVDEVEVVVGSQVDVLAIN